MMAAPGSKVSTANSGTIVNAGGASGNDDAIRISAEFRSGVSLLYNAGSISAAGAVNDSDGVRLGKVYAVATITIDNGVDPNGDINTNVMVTSAVRTLSGRAVSTRAGTATGFGSSSVDNYGMISTS